ncbi:hypothetical protein ISS42_01775 [Candidatus Shapirobacteria bacterium]|nr:hypothetical protein [Candidatus Shapirobacteria bacterium]
MSVQLVVRIPEEQKLMLEILANNRGVSVAEITRTAIKKYAAQTPKNKGLFTRLAKIGQAKKIGRAPNDLSINYKKYLYQR